jgi:hypothetical protein
VEAIMRTTMQPILMASGTGTGLTTILEVLGAGKLYEILLGIGTAGNTGQLKITIDGQTPITPVTWDATAQGAYYIQSFTQREQISGTPPGVTVQAPFNQNSILNLEFAQSLKIELDAHTTDAVFIAYWKD